MLRHTECTERELASCFLSVLRRFQPFINRNIFADNFEVRILNRNRESPEVYDIDLFCLAAGTSAESSAPFNIPPWRMRFPLHFPTGVSLFPATFPYNFEFSPIPTHVCKKF